MCRARYKNVDDWEEEVLKAELNDLYTQYHVGIITYEVFEEDFKVITRALKKKTKQQSYNEAYDRAMQGI